MASKTLSMKQSEKAEFTSQVSSNVDEDYLTAEIYYGEFLVCVVDTQFGEFGVNFYSDPKINYQQDFIHANLDDLLGILERTKTELRKYPNGLHVK